MKVFKIKLVGYTLKLIVRWRNKDKVDTILHFNNRWELGIWFKRAKLVGKKGFNNPKNWTHVNEYAIGINLLFIKATVLVTEPGAMTFEI